MYIFAEPYEENEIEAVQNGEYIKALRMAEARARAEKEKEKNAKSATPADESDLTLEELTSNAIEEPLDDSKTSSSSEEEKDMSEEIEETEGDSNVEFNQPPVKDVLAMILKAQNHINGKQVTGPPKPTAQDLWEITYTFETCPPDRAIRLYQMCQERRRKVLDEEFREQILEPNETARKAKEWNQGFLKHLKLFPQAELHF